MIDQMNTDHPKDSSIIDGILLTQAGLAKRIGLLEKSILTTEEGDGRDSPELVPCGPTVHGYKAHIRKAYTAETLPDGPWVASNQYDALRFVLSSGNQIMLRCSHLPFALVQALADAANDWMLENPGKDAQDE